jgi:hypothetical protein
MHAQYQCRTVAATACPVPAAATTSQQDRGKLRYGGEPTNAVGVVRFTSCLRSGCSWCSLADSAMFSRWAEAVELLGAKFGKEHSRVGSIAGSMPSVEESSHTCRFLAVFLSHLAPAERYLMLMARFASHHVCAAGAVGVHWLTLRCSLAGQKQWNLWAQNSRKSVSASAASQTACSLWRGHQTLCHSRAVPKRQSLRQENPTRSVFASATSCTASSA